MMKHSFGMIALLLLMCGPVAPGTKHSTGKITVKLTGFKNSSGMAGISIYNSPAGFPSDPFKSMKIEFVAIDENAATITFSSLAEGEYAISAFHDENNNGRLESTWYGAPKEGVGVSNNIRGNFGAPKFDEAKFLLDRTEKVISINLFYL